MISILFGLGFGDDEDTWEILSVHKTLPGAQREMVRKLADPTWPNQRYKIEQFQLSE